MGPGSLGDRERGPSVAHDAPPHSASGSAPSAPPQHPGPIKSPPSWNEAPVSLSIRHQLEAKYKKRN